mgnify:CR=1 FL=1
MIKQILRTRLGIKPDTVNQLHHNFIDLGWLWAFKAFCHCCQTLICVHLKYNARKMVLFYHIARINHDQRLQCRAADRLPRPYWQRNDVPGRRHHRRLAKALAAVINLMDPHVIVLGGGVSNIASVYDVVPQLWQEWVFSDSVVTPLKKSAKTPSSTKKYKASAINKDLESISEDLDFPKSIVLFPFAPHSSRHLQLTAHKHKLLIFNSKKLRTRNWISHCHPITCYVKIYYHPKKQRGLFYRLIN